MRSLSLSFLIYIMRGLGGDKYNDVNPSTLNSPIAPHGPQQDPSTLSPQSLCLTFHSAFHKSSGDLISKCLCGSLPLEGPWPLWAAHGPL